jgi:hypothetical protein
VIGVAALLLLFSIAVLIWALYTGPRPERMAPATALDPGMVARSLREDALQARIARLTLENEQLAELAARRFDLLRLACVAQGLTVLPEMVRDTELLQAVRAAALLQHRGEQRLRHELAVRDDALAALGALVLREPVSAGQYGPDELVQLAAARARTPRGSA